MTTTVKAARKPAKSGDPRTDRDSHVRNLSYPSRREALTKHMATVHPGESIQAGESIADTHARIHAEAQAGEIQATAAPVGKPDQAAMINLRTVLVSGSHHVHTRDCADWKRKPEYRGTEAEGWNLSSATEYDVILACGEDIIAEHDPSFDDDEAAGVAWYADEVKFFPCTGALVRLDADARQPKAAEPTPRDGSAETVEQAMASVTSVNGSSPNGSKATKRLAKQDLATRLVLAAAEMVNAMDGSELAMGVDSTNVAAVTAARDEALRTVALWLHHLPADRERWVTVLPKPDRSDWR